jgi:alkylhydroperoxidase/carboxymuconolactone decarboxylase family protein YurZ
MGTGPLDKPFSNHGGNHEEFGTCWLDIKPDLLTISKYAWSPFCAMNAKEPTEPRLRYEKARGYWPSELEYVIKQDPELFKLYERYTNHPWRHGVLAPKHRELILLAINTTPTHLNEAGARLHIKNALRLGASKEEIIEAIETSSIVSIHAITYGLPIAAREYEKVKGKIPPRSRASSDVDVGPIKEKFIRERGYWSNPTWGHVLRLDPKFMDVYTDYSSHRYSKGVLPQKIKEFMLIAIDAGVNHIYGHGIVQHTRVALKLGATMEEILEVFELVTELGFEDMTLGFRILDEELAKK